MNSPTTIIHTPTNQLNHSLDFYRRLNFQVLSEASPSLVTDGKVVIEINPDRFARAGLKLFKKDWSIEIAALEQLTILTKIEGGHLLADPNGVRVYLMNHTLELAYQVPEKPFGITGNFAGVSLETTDMAKSAAFWQALGFAESGGSIEQEWVTYENGSSVSVSLMNALICPHLFFNPSLTYFNSGKNLENIHKIREAGIPITEEITHFNKEGIIDNIIIRDPGGYGFFIFND